MYLPSKIAETETPRTFTPDLRGLVAWLETQDPETKYNYADCYDCLMGRFASVIGRPAFDQFNLIRGHYYLVAFGDHEAHPLRADPRKWTYGGALTRARAALGATP